MNKNLYNHTIDDLSFLKVPGATHVFGNVNKGQNFNQFWNTIKRKKKA
jgi:hypothetical protein